MLYVPKLKKNLFSVGACTSKNFEVVFEKKAAVFKRDGVVFGSGLKQNNNIYCMLFKAEKVRAPDEANVSTTDLQVWHERLGHVNKRVLCKMIKNEIIHGVKCTAVDDFFCEACPIEKSQCAPFTYPARERKTEPGEMFYTDVCGPMSVKSLGGSRYFLIFKDDASGFRYVYFMQHKLEVFVCFKKFEKLVANRFGKSMKRLLSDNGREYRNHDMSQYLASRGIELETTAPHTPQQNGRAERDNRTIVESARTMIEAKKLSLLLWTEAVGTAVHVLNRVFSNGADKTPYEIWTGKSPDVSYFRVFGSTACGQAVSKKIRS